MNWPVSDRFPLSAGVNKDRSATGPNKKRRPMNSCGRRFKNKNRKNLSVMLTAFAFGCVDSSLDDAKGHSEPDDTERVP